jgi:hypothetical protein
MYIIRSFISFICLSSSRLSGSERMKWTYDTLVRKSKGRDNLGVLSVDMKIILK